MIECQCYSDTRVTLIITLVVFSMSRGKGYCAVFGKMYMGDRGGFMLVYRCNVRARVRLSDRFMVRCW